MREPLCRSSDEDRIDRRSGEEADTTPEDRSGSGYIHYMETGRDNWQVFRALKRNLRVRKVMRKSSHG